MSIQNISEIVSNKTFRNKVVDRIPGTRQRVYQIVGIPITSQQFSNCFGDEDEEIDEYECEDLFHDEVFIPKTQCELYKMPCCYFEDAPHPFIFGMAILTNTPWTDYELFDLFSLEVITPETIWDKVINLPKRSIKFAKKVYNSNPNIPSKKGEWNHFYKVGAFALEFIKKVIIKKKFTAEEFMEYKNVDKYQLYKIYFDDITTGTIKHIKASYKKLPELLQTKDAKITNIVMSDDCYTCT